MYRIHGTCISTTFKLLYCSCCEYIISYESTLGYFQSNLMETRLWMSLTQKGARERCEILGGGCADPFGMCYQGESLLGGLSWGGKGGRRSWWESAGEDVEVWIVGLRTGSVHLSLNWGRPIWKPVNFAIFQYLQIFWGVSFYENIHYWSRSRCSQWWSRKDVDDDKRQRWLMARSRLRGRAD